MLKPVLLLVAGPLALPAITACHKNDAPPLSDDTLIFGSFYGECAGEGCIEMYRLDPAQQTLAEDTVDKYPSFTEPYRGSYVPRSQASYQRAFPLRQQVPAQLLNTTANVIGQPDAGDWGGYYVETSHNGIRRFWLIDTKKSNLPTYLHAFTDSLRVHIQALK